MSFFFSSLAKTLSGDASSPKENNAMITNTENVPMTNNKIGDLNQAQLQTLRVKTPLSDASNTGNRRKIKAKALLKKHLSPRSKTVQALHQALLKMQQENATLKVEVQTSQDEKDRLTMELEAVIDEKDGLQDVLEALDENAQKETEALWEHNQTLQEENAQLQRKVAQLELALNTTSRQAEERLHQVLAGQEQLEKALELVAKKNQPWWQCQE